jgi:hypothetical protein
MYQTLADCPLERIRLACTKCQRWGELSRNAAVRRFGADAALKHLRPLLSPCPDPNCGLYYVDLEEGCAIH